jgi:hypothetical protein
LLLLPGCLQGEVRAAAAPPPLLLPLLIWASDCGWWRV